MKTRLDGDGERVGRAATTVGLWLVPSSQRHDCGRFAGSRAVSCTAETLELIQYDVQPFTFFQGLYTRAPLRDGLHVVILWYFFLKIFF